MGLVVYHGTLTPSAIMVDISPLSNILKSNHYTGAERLLCILVLNNYTKTYQRGMAEFFAVFHRKKICIFRFSAASKIDHGQPDLEILLT